METGRTYPGLAIVRTDGAKTNCPVCLQYLNSLGNGFACSETSGEGSGVVLDRCRVNGEYVLFALIHLLPLS